MTESEMTSAVVLKECVVLGGSGFPFSPGRKVDLFVGGGKLLFRGENRSASVDYLEVADILISGPGAVTTGGGFVGGGFGVEGAIEGVAIATVLNALSTRTKTHTFITVTLNFGEVHLHYSGMEPNALRIALADIFVKLRKQNPEWIAARTRVLEEAHAQGLLSADGLATLKENLRSQPSWPDPISDAKFAAQIRAADIADAKAVEEAKRAAELLAGPKGICPNCDSIIPLKSETCPKCKADFGVGSAWRVTPV